MFFDSLLYEFEPIYGGLEHIWILVGLSKLSLNGAFERILFYDVSPCGFHLTHDGLA